VCLTLADRAQAGVLYQELEAFEGQTMQVGFTVNLGPADRLRGNMAALLGRRAEAELHFAAARELAVAAQSPVWRARIAHDWAVALAPQPALLHEANELAMQVGMGDLVRHTRRELLELRTSAEDPSRAVSSLPDGLSSREVEVLRLVAQGLSNREIGRQLFISPNTVANHIRAVLQKTGTANRAEATAYAARHGLLV
jgi:DNA-binding CsgD family transcriptional regulator